MSKSKSKKPGGGAVGRLRRLAVRYYQSRCPEQDALLLLLRLLLLSEHEGDSILALTTARYHPFPFVSVLIRARYISAVM